VERVLSTGKVRRGVVAALDLEKYDHRRFSKSLIRTTEGTFTDKLNPRIEIRRDAALEVPHILVLIDDPEKRIIEPLFDGGEGAVFDFELMMGGGRLKYYFVGDDEVIGGFASRLEWEASPGRFREKYGVDDDNVVLYAMGDGNHSFAAAQKFWEELREGIEDRELLRTHPARYALVEIVNIHDEGMEVEAIHRVLQEVNPEDVLKSLKSFFEAKGGRVEFDELEADPEEYHGISEPARQCIPYRHGGKTGLISITGSPYRIPAESLLEFLKDYEGWDERMRELFIHGEKVVTELSKKEDSIGFYLPKISREGLFKAVIEHGAFPRKSISIGHARDKKYYFECRRIRQ
jgi:hypothetical protein